MSDDVSDDPIRSADQYDEPTRSLLRNGRWTDAMRLAESGDAALLSTLLLAAWPIPPTVRQWLAERATMLASKPRGRPTILDPHTLATERRHYAAVPDGGKERFAIDCAEHYGVGFEVMLKMLRGKSVK